MRCRCGADEWGRRESRCGLRWRGGEGRIEGELLGGEGGRVGAGGEVAA